MAKSDKHNQVDKFRQAARELGCDEDETTFDEKLRKLARQEGDKDNAGDQHK